MAHINLQRLALERKDRDIGDTFWGIIQTSARYNRRLKLVIANRSNFSLFD